jgi:hypothetical protein
MTSTYRTKGWVMPATERERKRIVEIYWDWKLRRNPKRKIGEVDARKIYWLDREFGLENWVAKYE